MTKRTDYFRNARSLASDRALSPLWRNAIFFTLGLLLGWLVLGWLIFPVKYTQAYPNDLQPEALNSYLLMTAESYAATHNLRDAGKRLRYWDDENTLGPMLYDLARSVETTNPADAAYLRVLARDLHLPATPAPRPAKSSGGKWRFSFWWLLAPLAGLIVLTGIIVIARRLGWLKQRVLQPEVIDKAPEYSNQANDPEDIDYAAPPAARPVHSHPDELRPEDAAWTTPAEEEEALFDEEHETLPEKEQGDDAEMEGGDEDGADKATAPEISDNAPFPTPEPYPAKDDLLMWQPHVLRFDGDPAYNKIIAIEQGDDYLGEYGLEAKKTAPNNPNLTITLELWLFDKSDTQTTDAALAAPVVAADPALKTRYVKDNMPIIPLRQGERISLQTAELQLEGRVRRVKFGATTSDGVPVIEMAEIEFLGKRR